MAVAAAATVALVAWGNGTVLLGRRLKAPDAVTLVALPALALGATALLLRKGWSREALGLVRPRPGSQALQAVLVVASVATLVPAAVVLAVDPSKRLTLVRLLIGTATGEELVHRSALLALWTASPASPTVTTTVSAAAFGAWHVAGAWDADGFHPLEVAGPAAFTMAFLWARLRYRSVAAPIVLHLVTNLPGILAGR